MAHRFTLMALLMAALTLSTGKAVAIEEPHYVVIAQWDDVEIREYAPHVQATTRLSGQFSKVGSAAFSDLGGYIFGNNKTREKIAMTAPVSQHTATDGDHVVAFAMPATHTLGTLPLPLESRVNLVEIPGRTVAALRYRGGWSEAAYRKQERRLLAIVTQRSRSGDRWWEPAGPPIWARYNGPWTPSFLRRNEVHLPLREVERADNVPTAEEVPTAEKVPAAEDAAQTVAATPSGTSSQAAAAAL